MIFSNSPLPSFPHKCADTLALTHNKRQDKVCVCVCRTPSLYFLLLLLYEWMFLKGRLAHENDHHLICVLSLFAAPLWIFWVIKINFFFPFSHAHMRTHTLSGSSLAEVSGGMLGSNSEAPGHLGLTAWTLASCVCVFVFVLVFVCLCLLSCV